MLPRRTLGSPDPHPDRTRQAARHVYGRRGGAGAGPRLGGCPARRRAGAGAAGRRRRGHRGGAACSDRRRLGGGATSTTPSAGPARRGSRCSPTGQPPSTSPRPWVRFGSPTATRSRCGRLPGRRGADPRRPLDARRPAGRGRRRRHRDHGRRGRASRGARRTVPAGVRAGGRPRRPKPAAGPRRRRRRLRPAEGRHAGPGGRSWRPGCARSELPTADLPGAGAGGGIGAMLMALGGAPGESAAELVMDARRLRPPAGGRRSRASPPRAGSTCRR